MEGFLANIHQKYLELHTLVNTRLSATRAAKLDSIDTSVSSRAAQSTANTIYANTASLISSQQHANNALGAILPQTNKIARSPTGGGNGWAFKWNHHPSGFRLTVSGSGVIRLLEFHSSSGAGARFRLSVDGNWIGGDFRMSDWGNRKNLAAGGIRFNSYFKLYFYQDSSNTGTTYVNYFYTLGD